MELLDLGLDSWFVDKARDLCGPGLSIARVTAVDRARYLIRDEHGELSAELTGRLRFATESSIELPCVGDWVCARYMEARSHASIHGVLPRRTFLRRKTPGKDVDFQMIAANIDVALRRFKPHFLNRPSGSTLARRPSRITSLPKAGGSFAGLRAISRMASTTCS